MNLYSRVELLFRMDYGMRYSKALDFVKAEYRKNVDTVGAGLVDELTGVADILEEMGYSTEYRLTAILRNLLRDTAARPDEILGYSNMDILEAVQLLNKDMDCNMYKYISDIRNNMLALPVKLAEHLYNLRCALGKSKQKIDAVIEDSQKYYAKCAKNTKFYEPILKARMKLKH